jgi:hypothetical protein
MTKTAMRIAAYLHALAIDLVFRLLKVLCRPGLTPRLFRDDEPEKPLWLMMAEAIAKPPEGATIWHPEDQSPWRRPPEGEA